MVSREREYRANGPVGGWKETTCVEIQEQVVLRADQPEPKGETMGSVFGGFPDFIVCPGPVPSVEEVFDRRVTGQGWPKRSYFSLRKVEVAREYRSLSEGLRLLVLRVRVFGERFVNPSEEEGP